MEELESRLLVPVIEAYGMTEASHQMTSNLLPPGIRKPGSVGVPIGCDLTIVDDAGNQLPPGIIGHIVIRGASVTPGYVEPLEPEASGFADGWKDREEKHSERTEEQPVNVRQTVHQE